MILKEWSLGLWGEEAGDGTHSLRILVQPLLPSLARPPMGTQSKKVLVRPGLAKVSTWSAHLLIAAAGLTFTTFSQANVSLGCTC